MMKWKIVLAALLFITMSLGTHAENLFVSLLGKSEKEVNERIEKIWEHFFTPADLSCYEAGDEKSVYYKGPMAQPLSWIQETMTCAPKECRMA